MSQREALIAYLQRDIDSFRYGIKWMESGILNKEETEEGLISGRAKDMIASYRRTVADLEQALSSLESEGGYAPRP
ncbi:MAG TPA: hypothetical protein VGY52_08395 [Roseiarcus sp.]|nr:hypothetical protein [Roseiarcus sp.]